MCKAFLLCHSVSYDKSVSELIINMANQKMVRGGRKDAPPGSPSQWGTLLEELQLGPLQPLQHQGHQAPAP